MTDVKPNQLPWNIAELRKAVEIRHGRELSEVTYQCAQSIPKRQQYMKYHYSEAKKFTSAEFEHLDPQKVLRDFVLGASAESDAFHRRRIQAEANLLALLQCVHATSDNLGHVIYYALNFEADPIRRTQPHKISIFSVGNALPPSLLKAAVKSLIDDLELKHVAALVNVLKHRNVIGTPISVSFVEDVETHGLRFEGFHYKNEWYPQKWAMRFVQSAFNALQSHVLGIGSLLNKELGL